MEKIRKINYGVLGRLMGWLLLMEAAMLSVPLLTAVALGERDLAAFALAFGVTAAAALCLYLPCRRTPLRLSRYDGMLLTSVTWVVFSLFGMIPFLLSRQPLGAADAYFESMSGFTTTGATVIADVEAQSRSLLLWRSMMQWCGGLGIMILMLALLPSLNQPGGLTIYNAESTGFTRDKLHPRIRQTVMSLWKVYISLTLLLTTLLWAGPMTLFDALCQAMTTMSTGGFSTRNASIGAWHSDYATAVITLFMLVAGVNFVLLYNVSHGRWRDMWHNDILRAYLLIVGAVWTASSVNVLVAGKAAGFSEGVLQPLFHTVSAITSTGFTVADFGSWGSFCVLLTVALMVVGACAGSTTGGLKVDRVLVLWKNVRVDIRRNLHPSQVHGMRVGKQSVSADQLRSITAFLMLYLIILAAGTLLTAAFGYSVDDALFAAASCLGNTGLGYGVSAASYGVYPDALKWVFSALMLLGRLEILCVVAVFTPSFWRR